MLGGEFFETEDSQFEICYSASMKNAVLFHGTGGNPESYWFPYLKRELEKRGYTVSVPALPNTENPKIEETLPFALSAATYDENTVLVGHSSGAPLILSILENIDVKIRSAIFVAGFFKPLNPPKPEPMVQTSYDWDMIRAHCARFVVLNSDHDPWGCNDVMGKELAEHVGGEFVLMKGEGHMGSTTFNQPYTEFPRMLDFIS